ncbi:MAG: NADH-quinone oxidoreductase subunit J [Anaerolineaceae bacterium]
MNLNFLQILFLINAVIILGAAILAVSVRNLVHAALWMVLSFFGVAILFVMLGTGFFAVIQVVIYIGAIAVLIMFAIMLTRREMKEQEHSAPRYWWIGALSVLGLLAILIDVISLFPGITKLISGTSDEGLVPALGKALVEPAQFGLVFEFASLLLLIALIGAVYLARERKPKNGSEQ